jgi:hypothetical protein
MKKDFFFVFFLILILSLESYGQNSDVHYFITTSCNLYLPVNNPTKGVYPVLWYDKNTDPKVLIGGFGFGFAATKLIKEKLTFKGHVNIAKQTYWDESIIFRDPTNLPMGQSLSASSDYTVSLLTLVHYSLNKRISIGTGLAAQVLIVSLSRVPDINNSNPSGAESIVINKFYKPIMPLLPVELSLTIKKTMFNLRYEYGLLNRLKGDLAKQKKDSFSLLTFEIGFKIR